jgi:hypothetical protein
MCCAVFIPPIWTVHVVITHPFGVDANHCPAVMRADNFPITTGGVAGRRLIREVAAVIIGITLPVLIDTRSISTCEFGFSIAGSRAVFLVFVANTIRLSIAMPISWDALILQ